MAEVIKYGYILDKDFLTYLKTYGQRCEYHDFDFCVRIIKRSCELKAQIVHEDERETLQRRAILNFGHTLGHALEAEVGYTRELLHGEAVAIGMVAAGYLAWQRHLVKKSYIDEMKETPVTILFTYIYASKNRCEKIIKFMKQDKKNKDGRQTYILPKDEGVVYIVRDIEEKELEEAIAFINAE